MYLANYNSIGGGTGGDTGGASVTISMDNGDLVGSTISVTHNLDTSYPLVQIYNNNNEIAILGVSVVDANNIDIDFTGYTPITGTWNITVKK